MSPKLQVILGSGPVGCQIARTLREQNIPVRAVNRSGQRPPLMPADVEMVAADVTNRGEAIAAAQGAAVLYQALNPPYHQWHEYFPDLQAAALTAAKSVGARYVSIDNLYMYDAAMPMTEDSPISPQSKKVSCALGWLKRCWLHINRAIFERPYCDQAITTAQAYSVRL